MIRLSATFVKDYLSCSKRGYYRINNAVDSVSSDDMVVGTIVHRVIEKKWSDGLAQGLAFAKEIQKEYNFVDLNANRQAKIERCIRNFYDNFVYLLDEGDQVEKFFTLSYSDSVQIVGKMDRITKEGYILDWKTSSRPPKRIDSDVQFIMYYMAYKQMYRREPDGVFFAALTNGTLIPYYPVDYLIDQLYGEVLPDIVKDIKQGKFVRNGLFTGACYGCQFNTICWKEMKKL